MFQTEK
jgi:Grx4 family monothiol glutaredoxin